MAVAGEAAADPPPTWQVAWRRTCRRDLTGDAPSLTERDVSWCYGHFDARSGRYLRPQSTAEFDARDAAPAESARRPEVPRGYALVSECDEDAALVRRRRRFEVRVRGQEHPALTLPSGQVPTRCARSTDGSRLAVTTDDGITVYARRVTAYVATARWTARGLGSLAFVDGGDALLGWRRDETLLTAWRIGAPVVARGLPTSEAPRSYACEPGQSGVPWARNHYAYDWEPPPPRADHGLLGMCDGADVFATDAAEFADQRADDRRWARAVAQRYGWGDAAPRVWRAPWGDRVVAWSYEGSPGNVYDYHFDVRVVEHGDTLYRVELETLHNGPADPEYFPDARYQAALDRGHLDALLRAMFDPRGLRRSVAGDEAARVVVRR